MKSGTPFVFRGEQRKAFQELKERLASAETLGYFDKDAPTQVIANASPVGLGAVLTQRQKDGPRAISYASRTQREDIRKPKKKPWHSCGHAKSFIPTCTACRLNL